MRSMVLAWLVIGGLAAAADPISFRRLQVGESIVVNYHSGGCFHSFEYDLEFVGGQKTMVSLTKIKTRWEGEPARKRTSRHAVGLYELNEEHLQKLDDLMTFYRRNDRKFGCTTIDSIEVRHKRGAIQLKQESFTDGSCSLDDKVALTFYELIAKVEQANRAAQD